MKCYQSSQGSLVSSIAFHIRLPVILMLLLSPVASSRAARCLVFAVPAFLGVAVSATAQAANCTADVVSGQLYSIHNLGSGQSLDVTGGSLQAGAPVQQWGYTAGEHQQFQVRSLGNGYWSIQNRKSGHLLDIASQSVNDGARLLQYPATGGYNQQWLLKKSTTGAYNIVARHSGKSVTVGGTASGAAVYQAPDSAAASQRWFFNPVAGGCGTGPDGFAAQPGPDGLSTTTGGGNAAPVLVSSCSALASALQSSAPAVVQIAAGATVDCRTPARSQSACAIACPSYQDPGKVFYRVPVGTQTCSELGASSDARYSRTRNETSIKVTSNKTLVGLGAGSKLIGASLNVSGSKNVIIRNLSIENVNPGLVEAGDAITLNNSSHVWIDHVRFNLISDGHVDIQGSRNVTLSWNRFDGANPAVCGGQHHYTNAVSNSQVTLHHNFWNKTSGRNPKLEGSSTRAHLYNNYWLDVSYFAINASGGAQAKVEGNFFANTSRPHWNDGNGLLDASLASNRYTGVSATDPYRHTGARVFGDIALYPYTVSAVDQLPAQLSSGTGPR